MRYTFTGRLTILRDLVGLQSVPGTLMLLPVFVLLYLVFQRYLAGGLTAGGVQ